LFVIFVIAVFLQRAYRENISRKPGGGLVRATALSSFDRFVFASWTDAACSAPAIECRPNKLTFSPLSQETDIGTIDGSTSGPRQPLPEILFLMMRHAANMNLKRPKVIFG
jgi:hypothetical protein